MEKIKKVLKTLGYSSENIERIKNYILDTKDAFEIEEISISKNNIQAEARKALAEY